jgi:hypothetical protein
MSLTLTMEQQAPNVLRVAPTELAETLYVVHQSVAKHLGAQLAERQARDASEEQRRLRSIVQELIPKDADATFLLHEAYRTAHQFELEGSVDPSLYDVYEILLEHAESMLGSVAPHIDHEDPVASARKLATFPTSPYALTLGTPC